MPEEMITIEKAKHDELVDDSIFLNALRAAGVDNWDGYDYACQSYREDRDRANIEKERSEKSAGE